MAAAVRLRTPACHDCPLDTKDPAGGEMAVEFCLLGDLVMRVDGVELDIGPMRQQCVLAVLLVEAGRTVTVDQLVDGVWGDRLPRSPRDALHGYISRLRGVLAAVPAAGVERRPGGYRFTGDPGTIDLNRFHHLVALARAQDSPALFEQALELWRGEALAHLDCPRLNGLRAVLEAERRTAELDLNDIRLRQGQHHELLVDLLARTSVYRSDERFTGQLMVALYRCGRQADALDHYQRLVMTRSLDCQALRELHRQILVADPALDPPSSSAPESPAPRELPAPPRGFVGRELELAALSEALNAPRSRSGAVNISAIGGIGGVGKTSLALQWAHENLESFPDGQLYVDLRGFDPAAEPLAPATAMQGFLRSLGVPPAAVPPVPDAQVALYRSMIADRRVLVLLDNAHDTAQVTPLIPAGTAPTVLVTSRHRLTGLVITHGARTVALDALSSSTARQLLESRLGAARLAAEPAAVDALLAKCAGLPLALQIVAARAAGRPALTLATLNAELNATPVSSTHDLTADLTVVFSGSYRALTRNTARLFRLLSLAPGPDIGLMAAASLAAQSVTDARRMLRELTTAYLLREHQPGRYRMHGLVRSYAARAVTLDEVGARARAERRLLEFYLHTAHTADGLLYAHRPPIELDLPSHGCVPEQLPDRASAMAWFTHNHGCLFAAQRLARERGWDAIVWQLAWAMTVFHWRRGQIQDHLAAWQEGLAAAVRLADPVGQAHAHRLIGHAFGQASRSVEAEQHLRQALLFAERIGDVFGQAHTEQLMSWLCGRQEGREQEALAHAIRALELSESLGNPVWTAIALDAVGWCNARLGRYGEAGSCCRKALVLHRRHRHLEGEADTASSLGYIARHTGRHRQAVRWQHQALTLFRLNGNIYAEADTLVELGHAHRVLGQYAEAGHAWRRAVELFQTQRRAEQEREVRKDLLNLQQSRTSEVGPVSLNRRVHRG